MDWLHRLIDRLRSQRLSPDEARILRAVAAGSTLKAHRYFDGAKVYRLHPLDGEAEDIDGDAVERLVRRRMLGSNQKFPAATFLLTERGREIAAALIDEAVKPLGASDFMLDE